MNYMLDKINLLDNKDEIIKSTDEIVDLLKNNEKLNDSEKLMAIELAVCKLNYELYNISGDQEENQFRR